MKNWQQLQHDPVLKAKILMRETVLDGIREFFKKQQFHEVETPSLWSVPSAEPYLEVFETQLLRPSDTPLRAFLLTSPEYAMKKLLAGGMGNIFQICKSFRNNEGDSDRHNPEFTILEWYRTPADYTHIMKDFEQLMLHLLEKTRRTDAHLTYQGKTYDLTPPYPRISVAEAFERYIGITADELLSVDSLKSKAAEKGYEVTDATDWEAVYNQLFLNEVEPHLTNQSQPVILYDYPASQAALSKKKASDPRFAERFEVYLAGLELGNAFSELTDANEQKERLLADLQLRKDLKKIEYPLDSDFIVALASGMPETGGIAVGVDRLVMIFADALSIDETLFFPAREMRLPS